MADGAVDASTLHYYKHSKGKCIPTTKISTFRVIGKQSSTFTDRVHPIRNFQGSKGSSKSLPNATANPSVNVPAETNTAFNPQMPASRLTMVNPKFNQTDPLLYAIRSLITFKWSFDKTTMIFAPENLAVEVTRNSEPAETWRIVNVSSATAEVLWDTSNIKSCHLIPYANLHFGL
ncbi:hypothetical protein BC939DRAFT_477888 [Gamsiella multidivaricata]|uniref:uncharacterized protein n=1 Tax=Gamsiella multidivaricata TaxID=101098 RepID=UPI00221E9233|nr:uncharacterized protein BC939DRAFT_477888 [Gamsiella multidivaricata]KAI7822150.1 hypothetical protein BC939DRAFT_477888 [Gamsiella multidivaricata]